MGSIVTIVGNRPQFIKMLPVSRAIQQQGHHEIVIHTGQHYDAGLSQIFFDELGLPTPAIQLETTKRSHAGMTAELMEKLEAIFMDIKPKHIMLYGDTNSTLAAALAAVKLHIKIAHIEAGPRMRDLRLPEEVNRITVDHISQLLFCPDEISKNNLAKENITNGVYISGDVMFDAFCMTLPLAREQSTLLKTSGLEEKPYALMTMHRPGNVDSKENIERLLIILQKCKIHVLFPMHLRTLNRIEHFGLKEAFDALPNLTICEPLGYIDMVAALSDCRLVITDSGGLQKEAYYAGRAAIVFLHSTPWPDLQTSGWQYVAGTLDEANLEQVTSHIDRFPIPNDAPDFYGDGHAAPKIVEQLEAHGFLSQNISLETNLRLAK